MLKFGGITNVCRLRRRPCHCRYVSQIGGDKNEQKSDYKTDESNQELGDQTLLESDKHRDISRLTRKQHILTQGKFEAAPHFEKFKHYRRHMYGIYGAACGYDPAIMWPSKEELKELKEYEALWEPDLDTLLEDLKQRKEDEENIKDERRLNVERSMKKMPELIRQHEAKLSKKREEERAREQKRELLLEEARDFFGYAVDPRDTKFQEMVEKKELAEKLAEKQRKKEQKLAKMMAKYQSVAATTRPASVKNTQIDDSNES